MRISTIIVCLFLAFTFANRSFATEAAQPAQVAWQQASCGEWQQAIRSYNQALATSPDDAVCLARRGYAFACLGNYKQAFADFASATKCDTNCPDAYSRRSRVYAWLGLQQLSKQDAHKALELAVSISSNPELLLEHAVLLSSVGKKQKSEEEVKQVLQSIEGGEDVSTFLLSSRAHFSLNQNQDAVSCLNQALKLSPGCFYLHLLRGWSYKSLNQWTRAISDFNLYTAHNPKNPLAFLGRGDCYYHLGRYAKAVEQYDQAIAWAPNYESAYYQRGLAHKFLKKYQKAIDDFSAAISLESTDAKACRERALLTSLKR